MCDVEPTSEAFRAQHKAALPFADYSFKVG
jgi:hypothetical protein